MPPTGASRRWIPRQYGMRVPSGETCASQGPVRRHVAAPADGRAERRADVPSPPREADEPSALHGVDASAVVLRRARVAAVACQADLMPAVGRRASDLT